jgi:ubiquinone/menaquinone biosynthesis C-methylase UbiE
MAPRVEPDGEVVAVDIQPEMLAMLEERARKANIGNVRTVLGSESDPRLPPGTCDLILLVDVYHELSDPAAMLEHMKAALKPEGRIALVEFRSGDPDVPIKPLHTMTKAQMKKEFASVDLAPVREFDGLPWQHLVFFAPKDKER